MNPSLKEATQRVAAELKKRGVELRFLSELPGGCLEFICSLSGVPDGDWNLLGASVLSSASKAGVQIRVSRSLVLVKQGAGERFLEGGGILVWGGLPALGVLIRGIQDAPRSAPAPVSRVEVPAMDRYRTSVNGSRGWGVKEVDAAAQFQGALSEGVKQ